MKIIADLHTHTQYSRGRITPHGHGSVAEAAAAARAKGLLLGSTDHGPGHSFYGLRAGDPPAIRREIEAVNEAAGREVMKFGVEANVLDFDGKTDLCLMDPLPDLRLLGYHKGVLPFGAGDGRFFWSTSFCKKGSYARLTDAILRAFERYPVDALTHPGEYIPVDIRAVARGAVLQGVALEINNAHGLALEDAAAALEEGAYFLLSSDAHRPENIGQVERAMAIAQDAGIPPERIINSGECDWKAPLRIGRFRQWLTEQR